MAQRPVKRPVHRPKNLNLLTIRLPVPAVVSILHRASGFILFLLLPVMLWALQQTLRSEEGFAYVQQVLGHPVSKLIMMLPIWAFWHHLCAGIRHLFIDYRFGMPLPQARWTAKLVLACSVLLTILSWIWLW